MIEFVVGASLIIGLLFINWEASKLISEQKRNYLSGKTDYYGNAIEEEKDDSVYK